MFVSRLEMIGFKSFATRIQLEFRPGVMAVVGPNGCGKTNIVDAVRWVLGEQRSGILRAERMEAVIFNGTNRRRPLGMAEVTLVIDNDKGRLPSPFTEVAITRRLFRSGESEYLINRNPCRLRDIYDLFSDTGFGHSAYSIIELAMVEGIITGPSESRRKLLEEAAGVAKFKARRISAKRRLESTSENLLRIEDIYNEVRKSYNALKRQAARTRKYQALAKAIEIKLLVELSNERIDIIEKGEPLKVRLSDLEDLIQDTEENNARAAADILTYEGEELVLLDKQNRFSDTLKRLDRREAEMRGEMALAEQRIEFIKSERVRMSEVKGKVRKALDSEKETDSETEDNISELSDSKANIETELAEIETRLNGFKNVYDESYRKLTDARRDEERITKELRTHEADTSAREGEHRRIDKQLKRLTQESGDLNLKIETLNSKITKGKSELKTLRNQVTEKKSELSGMKAALENKRIDHAELLQRKARSDADLETVSSLFESHRAHASTVIGWSEELRERLLNENLPPLIERLECNKEHHVALAAALNPILDAIEQSSQKDAFRFCQTIDSSNRVVMYYPVSCVNPSSIPGLPDGYHDCISGADLVQNGGELGKFLRSRLWNLVLVPSRDVLHDLADWGRENNVRLVSLDGELVEPDGIYYSGSLDREGFKVGWENRLGELEAQLVKTKRTSLGLEQSVDHAARELKSFEENTTELRNDLNRLQDRIASLERECSISDADLGRFKKNLTTSKRESGRLKNRLDTFIDTRDSQTIKARLKTSLAEAVSHRKSCGEAFLKVEQQRMELVESRAGLSTEKSRITERFHLLEEALKQSRSQSESRKTELATLEAQLAEREAEMERVQQARKNLAAQIELMKREKDEVTENLAELKDQKTDLKQRRHKAKQILDESQAEQKDAVKQRSRIEADLIGLRERLREIDRRLIEEAGTEPSSIDEMTASNAEAELIELGYGDIPLEKLRIRLGSLGPVNMLALEEIKAVEGRFKFLKDQKQDLEKGIELLEETIERINIEARQKFRETFDEVNRNFQELFRVLFEGGEARIQLDGTDPLEADIRIWVNPSGKKLRSLSMLSGGEKALTAIALLFAIYQVRPSPFCILDEVDAPLDDANILRFNRLISRFSQETQFLVVTHNKRTMEAADSLFGVTLGEDGTSRLVSVKIEKKEQDEISDG